MKIHREMNNDQIADLLEAVAAAYQIKGNNQFKVVAYQKAGLAMRRLAIEARDFWEEGKLEEIPGVGISIAAHLTELFAKGKVPHFNKVLKILPPSVFKFIKIPGVGVKIAYKLANDLNIKESLGALTKLKKAAKKGKIAVLEGFGQQSEKEILEGIKKLTRDQKRMTLPFAWELAQKVIKYLNEKDENKKIIKIEPLGSLRRMSATVGDVDIAVATDDPQKVIKRFICFPEAKKVVVAGKNTARVIHRSGEQIDLKTMKPEAFGALLQHFTGSKDHNIHLREIAQKKDLSVSEYGIKFKKKGRLQLKEYPDEQSFYHDLGLSWVPPELREDSGEIEAALKNKLPVLISQKDIKGDLHLHSSFPTQSSHDDGLSSAEDLVTKAQSLGYQYLGLTEHNPVYSQHNKKQVIQILKRKKDISDKINYSRSNKLFFFVLNGLEIDIKRSGELAVPEEAFAFLDFAIASIHSSFKLNKKQMTKRVLLGLSHPKVKILGHPTGRKIGQRDGYDLDWDQIFSFCKKNNKYLEVNSWFDRLDLPDLLIRDAVKNGVKMVINTDAHAARHMDNLKYGLSQARRGWATTNDIINTLSYNKLIDLFGLKKGGER